MIIYLWAKLSTTYGILQELDDHGILILDFNEFDQNFGGQPKFSTSQMTMKF